MTDHTLFSPLDVAPVPIQPSASNLIPNGRYQIESSGFALSVYHALVHEGTQGWDVRTVNGHNLVEVVLPSSTGPLYVAPVEGSTKVELSRQPYDAWEHGVTVWYKYIVLRSTPTPPSHLQFSYPLPLVCLKPHLLFILRKPFSYDSWSSVSVETMLGRSVFSLLAIVAVTIQSCAASFIDGGKYKIQVSTYASLSVSEVQPNAIVQVFNDGEYQEWEIRPSGEPNVFEIVLPRGPFYVAPAKEGNFVELSLQRYQWRFLPVGKNRYIIERTDIQEEPWALSVSPIRIFPPRAATEPIGDSSPQSWSVVRVDGFQQESRSQCGPRRLSRDSFYLQ
ncbi:MAG: hypothetical protein J3Q66DRAFT_372535 [Benniella sp.]|nr:MAG: hypothetical protein J3Q66DRAFT_372535 [Benniella sp.]